MNIRQVCFATLLCITVLAPSEKAGAAIAPLWFSLAPANPSNTVDCELHPTDEAEKTVRTDKPATKGVGNKPKSGRETGKKPRFESEHRAVPERNYWLNLKRPSPSLKAYIMRPDGAVEPATVQPLLAGVQVQFATPIGDSFAHGANNLYAVDRYVIDDVLAVRTAKWLTIHHSCGWGHGHKFNKVRQTSLINDDIPLEIVIDNLWDTNFHSKVMSGDKLNIRVLHKGQGAANAKITVTTDKGWSKVLRTDKDGRVQLQLIRDHYPANWISFKRSQRSAFKVVAEYEKAEQGIYEDTPYSKVQMSSTFEWRYYPARQEYHSYAWGLGIALAFSLISGFGVYAHRERRKRPLQEIVFDE